MPTPQIQPRPEAPPRPLDPESLQARDKAMADERRKKGLAGQIKSAPGALGGGAPQKNINTLLGGGQ